VKSGNIGRPKLRAYTCWFLGLTIEAAHTPNWYWIAGA